MTIDFTENELSLLDFILYTNIHECSMELHYEDDPEEKKDIQEHLDKVSNLRNKIRGE